jgi:hypothetical protein
MDNTHKPASTETGKKEPQNVSGKTEEQAKEKSEPLQNDETEREDQEEGNMNNGELGANLGNG